MTNQMTKEDKYNTHNTIFIFLTFQLLFLLYVKNKKKYNLKSKCGGTVWDRDERVFIEP